MKKSIKYTGLQIPNNISQIAQLVKRDWKNVYFGAVPYLDAMESLNSIKENYFNDSGSTIITYFLANATTWRGDTAKAVKAKLKELLADNGF